MIELIGLLSAIIAALLGLAGYQRNSHNETKRELDTEKQKSASADSKVKLIKRRIEIDEETDSVDRDELLSRLRDDLRD